GELPQLQYYPLGRVNGEYAVGILSSIVSGVTIKHEPESKRLSVVASESDHRILQETLVKLESAAPEQEARTLRVYGVTKSQQARFSTVLQGLTEEMPELQVLTGGEPDEMIIWAKPSQHTIVDTVLAQLDRDIPADQKPSLVVYPISKVEAESVAEVLREIFPDATINVDSRASRLLVRARPAMQKTIKSAIRQLDEEIPDGREIKLMAYPVKGLNVETILSLINQEVPQVTVIRDDTAETFIIRGQLEDHQKVAELLETLRVSEVGKRIPAVYPLSQGDPNRVREFFERAFPGAMAVVDPDARTLTILATTEDQEQIRKFIEDLRRADAEHPHTSELKVYSVRGASSTELRLIISESVPRARLVIANDQLMAWAQADDQAVIQGIVDGLRDASGKLTVTAFDVSRIDVDTATSVLSTVAPGTQFMIGRNGRALIATVDENTKANVEAALAQLEKSPAARQEQTLRFYTVDRSTAPSVQNVLNAAVPEVSLLLSSDGTQLFARVTSDQHAKIAETLAQIAEANPFESIRVLRMYSIAKSGTNTSTVLQRMVPSAVVNVGSQPAQLMIEATESDHAQIEQLISQLEHAAGDSDRELKFYDVDPATIGNIRTTLTSVVPEVTLTTSTDNTRLIAHVTSAQHERIMETLQQLDVEQPFSSNRTLKVYSTTDSGANTSSVLQRMVPAAVVNSGGKPDQLLVEATERDHQRIVQLITQLEEASDDTERQLQFYNVDPATLSNTQTTLRSVVPEVTLTPSTDNTRLIAHVTGEQHERIVQTLEQLASEQPFNSNRLLKVYSIDRSGANTASVLQRMVPSAVVNAGSQPNQLLVEATEHDHQRIVQVITQLEEASGDTERQLKFYDVNPATVSSTQSALTSIVPEVTFTVSTDSTRLIAHVTDEQHEKIAQTLEQLSAEQPFRSNRVLKFYSVAKAGSDASSVLQRLVPSAVITSGTQSGQLMVEATPAQHEEIARLLTQITAAAAHDSLKVRFYAVDQRNLENIRSVVTAAVPDVSFRASADGTQLIAVVSDDQHAKIIEAVQALAQEQPFQSN
ncbi:MAG: secretin N-terminal domain-containing protein, partial [Planctomycetaceae bacterium]